MVNQMDRRSFDLGASAETQGNIHAGAVGLLSLIEQRGSDVAAALLDFFAGDVSEEYAAKEERWTRAGNGVKDLFTRLETALGSNDQTATTTMKQARAAVDGIG